MDQVAEVVADLAGRTVPASEIQSLQRRLQQVADRIEQVQVPDALGTFALI